MHFDYLFKHILSLMVFSDLKNMIQAQNRSLECKNLHDYLKTLPSEVLDQLYNHPATCLAVFRELPALAKQFIMRLLHVQQAVPQAVVSSWVTHQFAQDSQASKDTLTSLRVSGSSLVYRNASCQF